MPVHVKIKYSHELGSFPLLRLSWMNGFLQQTVNDYVSIVNCEAHMQRLGIQLEEETCTLTPRTSMEVVVSDADNHNTSVGGVVFDEEKPRLAHIDNFKFEIKPRGRFPCLSVTVTCLAWSAIQVVSSRPEKINIGSVFLSANAVPPQLWP